MDGSRHASLDPTDNLSVGDRCLFRCYQTGTWYESTIVDKKAGQDYKIHYNAWSKRHDRWLSYDDTKDNIAYIDDPSILNGSTVITKGVPRYS